MKRIVSLAVVAILISCMNITVWANDEPELAKNGSISISMRSSTTQVGGGTLTIYRVCEALVSNGDYSFRPVGGFVDCGESFADLNSPCLAKRLVDYAESNDIAGDRKAIDENGTVSFVDLDQGIYLLVQETPAEGYKPISPFLVAVPLQLDGVYPYDVVARPKVQLAPVVSSTTEPEPTNDLSQADQLKLLTASGFGLFVAGLTFRSNGKEGHKEKEEG